VGEGEKEKEGLSGLFNIPAPASAVAGQVDSVFLFILAVGLFFFVITQGALIYFALRYRKRRGDPEEPETPQIKGNVVLEGVWILVPTVLIFAIFAYGYVVFMRMEQPLANATQINVVAKQWLWEFEYPDGRKAINELRLAVGEPVDLVMTSDDVIHSLFIPEFRMKQDILPGRYTHMYLQPEKAGEYQIFCAEYCGAGHSTMLARLVVMEPVAYHEWQEKQEEKGGGAPSTERGEHLVESSGCLACHTLDGTAKVGPSFKGLFGRQVALSDGSTVTADEDYIRESILDPNAKVVKGFQPVMPTFKGTLSGSDITSVIDYLKTLGVEGARKAPTSPENGRRLVEKFGCLACHTTDGSPKVGPSFKGIYGTTAEMDDASTAKVDETYIRQSVIEPSLKIVKGYKNLMPSFKGRLEEGEIADIAAYIRSLSGGSEAQQKPAEKPGAAGEGGHEKGAKLVEDAGCLGCHSTDGSPKFGPTFKGLYGRTVTLADGTTVKADEAYIKESVEDPGAKVVKGYPPAMPSFKGRFSPEELDEVADYIESLKR